MQKITLKHCLLIFSLLVLSLLEGYSQQKNESYEVTLSSGSFIPNITYLDSIIVSLGNRLNVNSTDYMLVQFKRIPSREERVQLKAQGITLLNYVNGNTWYAKISNPSAIEYSSGVFQQAPLIRWVGAIEPSYKLSETLLNDGIASWGKLPNGKVKLCVNFHKDVSKEEAKSVLSKYDVIIETERRRRTGFDIIIDESKYQELLTENSIRLVENSRGLKEHYFNDGSRSWTSTGDVHIEGIRGDDVIVGIWDGDRNFDEVDDNHSDLRGRVIYGENPRTNTTNEHATHVAGTIAGDGSGDNNLIGHAPNVANIVSYGFRDEIDGVVDYVPEEMGQAIDDHEIVIANNSWGYTIGWNNAGTTFINNQSSFGNYSSECEDYDDLVREDNLVIVFAAGNDRNDAPTISSTNPSDADQGTGNNGYATMSILGSAKNVITVGAIDDLTGDTTTFTNFGPTDDGRIKPDLVAPGARICSTDDDANNTDVVGNIILNSCSGNEVGDTDGIDSNGGYTSMSGTSMAAPAVSGISALLLQAYREEFFETSNTEEQPLASTIKALLIQSAQDLGNDGPDFQYGWGGVNAMAAYELIDNRLFLESEFRETGQEDMFYVEVLPGASEFKATIAWDDVPSTACATCPTLVNDLDIVLEDPNNTEYQPWVLDATSTGWTNAATTGVDRVNNVEQVFVANPMAGRWKIKIKAHRVAEPAEDPQQKYSLVSSLPFVNEQSVSVVQVIDRTGSMRANDYIGAAKKAAQHFIGLMKTGDQVGVVAFADDNCDDSGTKATDIFDLRTINNDTDKSAAINRINNITADGCTSIGAGINQGQASTAQLTGAVENNRQAMVLLTDGFENTTPWVENRPDNQSNKPANPSNIIGTISPTTEIYTIALGKTADTDLLEKIANETGGKFYESPTILSLLSIYYQIRGDVGAIEVNALAASTNSGEEDTEEVIVEKNTREVTFSLGWLQPNANMTLRLIDPEGKEVAGNYLNKVVSNRNGIKTIRIVHPKEGKWKARISKRGSTKTDYTFASFVAGNNLLTDLLPSFSRVGDCLVGKVQLKDERGQPIKGAVVNANIRSPKINKYTQYIDLINNQVKDKRIDRVYPAIFQKADRAAIARSVSYSASENATTDAVAGWAQTLLTEDNRRIENREGSIFKYDIAKVLFRDDGKNGDQIAGDGIYSYCFSDTKVAGNYQIDLSIKGAEDQFERKLLRTVVVNPAKASTKHSFYRIVQKGNDYQIAIFPFDKFRNSLGPNLGDAIQVETSAGQLLGSVLDMRDGIYFQKIDKAAANSDLKIKINGEEIKEELSNRVGISAHSGRTFPLGDFETNYSSGELYEVDFEYRLNHNLSLELLVGRYEFKDDFRINGLSLSFKGSSEKRV